MNTRTFLREWVEIFKSALVVGFKLVVLVIVAGTIALLTTTTPTFQLLTFIGVVIAALTTHSFLSGL